MSELIRIQKDQLPQLRNLYRADWPSCVTSYAVIDHFIDRFNKHPNWEGKVKFWTLSDKWKASGTFAMINENDNYIMFDTIESWPFPTLQRTLELLNYDRETAFISFREIFRPLVLDVIRVQNLEATFDSSTRLLYSPRETIEMDEIK